MVTSVLRTLFAFPRGETHVVLGVVGALGDEFGGGLPGGGPVEFVLYDLEELLGLGGVGLVIGGEGEDVADPEIHPFLAGADVADAFEEFIEIV